MPYTFYEIRSDWTIKSSKIIFWQSEIKAYLQIEIEIILCNERAKITR